MVEVSVEENSVNIKGNIKSIDDYLAVKKSLQDLTDSGCRSIEVCFTDSVSITSSIIGFMLKLINVDKIDLRVSAGDKKLVSLLEELELSRIFQVREL
ncbi:hypothetical protein EP073_11025 [Geovibrio thiophilus]|uniref:STAS domain-containing protein n=1 Tax=Geovibrio thiophilus TaxID=139438 RepID=A0A410K0E0_9BACT|nr:hypothetical protein [Geovibrio thiophilus]QAR33916.1 hypothetical protein EP073_11025 [Geovibrio thiophilus]